MRSYLKLIKENVGIKNLYVCECGKEKLINKYNINSGRSTSCGCKQREWAVQLGLSNRKYEYGDYAQLWHGMHNRCYNVKNPGYKNYGGRGIRVCKRWHDYFNFKKDMGPRPPYSSLDRIDNNGDYKKVNCRWANCFQQANNTRRNKKYLGKSMAQWARDLGMDRRVIYMRLRSGWTEKEAFTSPKVVVASQKNSLY